MEEMVYRTYTLKYFLVLSHSSHKDKEKKKKIPPRNRFLLHFLFYINLPSTHSHFLMNWPKNIGLVRLNSALSASLPQLAPQTPLSTKELRHLPKQPP